MAINLKKGESYTVEAKNYSSRGDVTHPEVVVQVFDGQGAANKIRDYIKVLSEYGTRCGEPYIKHLYSDIWELRPLRDRILFTAWDGERFILLHHFMKQTQKTPQREIEKAMKNWKDLLERSKNHER